MIVVEGQWREELLAGAPARGLPPRAPNLEVLVLAEHRPLAGRLRAFDRALGERPEVALHGRDRRAQGPGRLRRNRAKLRVAASVLGV
jgi:hypothetical protein